MRPRRWRKWHNSLKEENNIRIERVVQTSVHSSSIIHVFPINIMKVWSVQIGTKKEPIINFYIATVNHNQTWLWLTRQFEYESVVVFYLKIITALRVQ